MAAVAVQLVTGISLSAPRVPWNWVVSAFLVLIGAALPLIFRGRWWAAWLGSATFAVSCTAAFCLVMVLITFLPSSANIFLERLIRPGLARSWPLAACSIMLVVNLSAALARRIRPPWRRNAPFIVCHLGILVIIAGMIAGSSQADKVNIVLNRGQGALSKFKGSNQVVREFPFALSLKEFSLENYPPKLAMIVSTKRGKRIESGVRWIKKGMLEEIADVTLEVIDYLPDAMPDPGKGWHKAEIRGAAPAALVRARTPEEGLLAEGWISCGGPFARSVDLPVAPNRQLIMARPGPKIFRAQVEVTGRGEKPWSGNLEVNHPLRIGPWRMYLSAYDVNRGAATQWVRFLLVSDTSLPVVYGGLILLLAGVFWLSWLRPMCGKGACQQ